MQEQLIPVLWLIALSIVMGVGGQLAIKLGVSHAGGGLPSGAGLAGLLAFIVRSPAILGGLLLYGIGALAWVVVLSRLDLSLAYPFLALNFVFVVAVSRFVLGEPVPWLRWVGVGVICVGILVVARSAAT